MRILACLRLFCLIPASARGITFHELFRDAPKAKEIAYRKTGSENISPHLGPRILRIGKKFQESCDFSSRNSP